MKTPNVQPSCAQPINPTNGAFWVCSRLSAVESRSYCRAIPCARVDMSAEVKKEIQLEIGHVLFIDIVGYSKRSIDDQHAAIEGLNRVVRASEQFQRAEVAGRLLKIPAGDGIGAGVLHQPGSSRAMRSGD